MYYMYVPAQTLKDDEWKERWMEGQMDVRKGKHVKKQPGTHCRGYSLYVHASDCSESG